MNKLSVAILIAFLLSSCHKKAVPVITSRTEQPAAPVVVTPVYASKEIEAGQLVYTTSCTKCHDAKPVQRWTVDEWKPILRSMIPKSKLDSTQAADVRAYVNAYAKRN